MRLETELSAEARQYAEEVESVIEELAGTSVECENCGSKLTATVREINSDLTLMVEPCSCLLQEYQEGEKNND